MTRDNELKRRVRARAERTGESYVVARSIVAAPEVAHPSPEIPQRVVNKTVAVRGRLHLYGPPVRPATALVVLDLDEVTVNGDATCLGVAENVNRLAGAVRASGGVVAWVVSEIGDEKRLAHKVGARMAGRHARSTAKPLRARLAEGLDVGDDDMVTSKRAASAFFPGNCDLHEQLSTRSVRSIFVAAPQRTSAASPQLATPTNWGTR